MAEDSPKYEVHEIHVCPDCGGVRNGCPCCEYTGEVLTFPNAPTTVIVWNTDASAAPEVKDLIFWMDGTVLGRSRPELVVGYRVDDKWRYECQTYTDASHIIAWAPMPSVLDAKPAKRED